MGKSKSSGSSSDHPRAIEKQMKQDAAARSREAAREKEEDDAYWRSAGDGAKSKAQLKKETKEAEKLANNQAKLEAKRMAAAEEEEMSEYGKKKEKQGRSNKMTQHELMLVQDRQRREADAQRERQMKINSREMSEEEYDKLVNVENNNRLTDEIDASGIDAAVKQLAMANKSDNNNDSENHPEKRVRGAYKVYEKEQLSILMSQMPGLTLSQYKEKMWKNFLKSEANPMNA